jgi:DNA-binding GntR family transcriptional regulator
MNGSIYEQIKQRILSLHYEPGQRLSQKELAAELGVSQTPIREALLRLQYEKFVSITPRSDIRVTKIDFKELKEIYRSRLLIEGELGRLAARNITDEQLEKMKSLLAACRKIKDGSARAALVDIDKKFRCVLFKAADSRTLQALAEQLYDQTLRVWHLTFDTTDFMSEVNIEAAEIEETIKSLSQRDPEIVQNLRRKVIMTWIDRLHRYFTRY